VPLIIGISCDDELRAVRQVPTRHGVLMHFYAQAVDAAGGMPFVLPNLDPARAAGYVAALDGLVLSGGDFDIDPALFNEKPHAKLGTLKPLRTGFELALLQAAEAARIPVLGICGGMQLMNVARGGTLYQDLPSERPGNIAHTQVGDRREPGHSVTPSGALAAILGNEPLPVNSTHHQAVRDLGRNLETIAVADDGIIEAFHDPALPFYMGIEWHPEGLADQSRQSLIYRAFIAACTRKTFE
jgi:putative glutamine amidotransferase